MPFTDEAIRGQYTSSGEHLAKRAWLASSLSYRLRLCYNYIWAVSSVVEHPPFKRGVVGSIPSRPTKGAEAACSLSDPHALRLAHRS